MKGRYLPLAFLMGFENMKMKFGGKVSVIYYGIIPQWQMYSHAKQTNWISRHKALRRALEGIQSRRTLANATGQKYALLIAPGDHWVHWPDK